MRKIWRRALAIALICALAMPVWLSAGAASDGMVRVKLTRLGSNRSVTIAPSCDYYVQGNPSLRIAAGSAATISADGSQITVESGGGSAAVGSSLKLMRSRSGKAGVRFTSPSLSNLFCGDLFISASGSVLTVILNIYIEDYLYGVVGYEMSPSWPVEALKAQAVAARNYALIKMRDRKNKDYHLVDNTTNQVFKGLNTSSSYASVLRAVDETKGIALYYGGALALCYYSASNGGQTESSKNAWGGALGYCTIKDDPYDLASSGTVKSASIRKDAGGLNAQLETALKGGVAAAISAGGVAVVDVRIEAIEGIEAKNPRFSAPSRLYQTLTFAVRATVRSASGESRTGTLNVDIPSYGGVESWYGLSINSGNNETVSVEDAGDAFRVSFRRFGHGVGLSQRGAQVMAGSHGMNAAQILQFYYPGTEARKLSLTDTTSDSKVTPQYTPIALAKAASGAVIYAGASESSDRIASLGAGAGIDVYAVQGDWAAVGSGGKLGFMPVSRLTGYVPVGSTITNVGGDRWATVTAANGAVLRALPVETSSQVAALAQGDSVRLYAFSREWAAVMTEAGQTGYAPVAALTVQSVWPEATATPAPDSVIVPDAEMYAQVTADGGMALRSLALESADVVGVLGKDTFVRVLAYNSRWARVITVSGKTGYGLCAEMRVVDRSEVVVSPTATATPAPTPSATAAPEVIVPQSAMYARTLEAASVYANADVASAAVVSLAKGTYVRVLAYTHEWVRVETMAGATGFVPIGRLIVVSEKEALATPAPDPGKVTVIRGRQYRYVAGESAKMYASFSERSQLLTTLPYGAQVQIGAYNAEWGCVKSGGRIGFIRLKDLTKKSPVPKSATNVIVAQFNAETTRQGLVYGQPDTGSAAVGKLPRGLVVRVYAYNNAFAYIGVGENRGFMELRNLKIVVG